MRDRDASRNRGNDGFSLIELMIMLIVLTLGILAVARLIPTSSREQLKDRLRTAGNFYAQDKMEFLRTLGSSAPELSTGRHPGTTSIESVGPKGTWARYWTVAALDEPLSNLTRLDVVVRWKDASGMDSVVATTYVSH